jgi:hypothetical protein
MDMPTFVELMSMGLLGKIKATSTAAANSMAAAGAVFVFERVSRLGAGY